MTIWEDFASGFVGFGAAAIAGWFFLPILRRAKIGQHIRDEVPTTHKVKAGTPTMGGLIFILGTLFGCATEVVLTGRAPSPQGQLILGLFLSMGAVGFVDDYMKQKRGRNLGLKARQKLVMQIALASAFMWGVITMGRGTEVLLPFTGKVLNLGPLYGLFGVFAIVGIANGVNLTDGLDGLAGSVVAIGLLAYYPVTRAASAAIGLPPQGALALGATGGVMGFLLYNRYPAKVMMGDVGSLSLGGLLAGLAVFTRTEILLLFFAFIPVIENITVIMQVISFQTFGKRIFKMTPIHHHFELLGWDERRITTMFRLFAMIFALLGLLAMGLVGSRGA